MRRSGMIDMSSKKKTRRLARAYAFVELGKGLVKRVKEGKVSKGDVLEHARIAGIMASKKTSELIPLCHNIDIDKASVDFKVVPNGVEIISEVKAFHKTGVEMEALAAAAIAALTIYDMCKRYKRDIRIRDIYLLEKRGGRSGTYKREDSLY